MTVLKMLTVITVCSILILLVANFIYVLKNNNTLNKRLIIANAIYDYQCDMTYKNSKILVSYSDMESYEETQNRIFDWGYKNILPPDKYELIEPYINKNTKEVKEDVHS